MAMSFVQSFSGTASNTTLSAALNNIAVGDVVVVWCGSGKKSDGIPNTAGEAPSFSSSTSGTAANDFTLVAQQNSADARISCYIKEYNSALLPKSVHMGSGWSGNGNHYVIHVVRDVDTGTTPFYVAASPSGPSQTNSPFPITEAVPSSGWPSGRTFTYLSGWSVEANCNFSSAQPSGSVVLSSMQSSGNRGALGTAHLTDTSLTSPNISIIGSLSGDEVSSISIVLVSTSTTTSTDHPSTQTETASSADSLVFQNAGSQTKTETSNSSDSLASSKTATSSKTETSTTSDSLSLLLEANSSKTETATTQDSLTLNKVAAVNISDSSQASDSLTSNVTKVFEKTETSSATDSLLTQNTGVFSKSDTSGTSDVLSVTKADAESQTDTASTSDTLNAFVSKPSIKTETSETNDTLSVTKSAGFVKTESASTSDTLAKTNVGAVDFVDTGSASDVYTDSETADVSEIDTTETSDTLTLFKQAGVSFTETLSTDDDGFSAVKQSSTVNTFDETDPSNVADALSVVKQSSFNKTETASGSDLIDIDEVAEVSHVDTSSVSDSLSVNVNHSFSKTESASTEDLKTFSSEKQAVFTDTTNSADSRLFVRTIAVGLIDTGSGSDGFVDQVDQERNFVDTSSSADTLVTEEPEKREITATIVGNGGIEQNLMTGAQALEIKDIWNVALNALGIATVQTAEGNSPQQTLLSNVFPLFRKQFLSDHLWNGAKKTADLTALTVNTTDQAVANRWKYVYQLPTDCMRVWRLNGQENKPVHMGGNSKIYTNRWEIEVVEVSSTKYRALCTNEDEARIEYVFDVGNDVDLLGPLTQHAMGMALAAFVATNFGKSATEIAQLEAQAKDAITAAKGVDGQEGTPQMFGDTSLLGVRSIGY